MMPAELMPRTIAMLPDPVPKLLYLGNELLMGHPHEILIHPLPPVVFETNIGVTPRGFTSPDRT